MEESLNLSDELFMIPSTGYALVDFYADWCSPCNAIAPFFDELKSKYPNITFLKCNIDDNREFAIKYEIESIPAFILFENGIEKDRLVGANKIKLEAMVSTLN
jgi:thioredoxin 1